MKLNTKLQIGSMEFMCMQMENHAPLQEGDNSKIKTFSISFSKTTIIRMQSTGN